MNQNRTDIPIQPVQQPILCSPYEKPNAHWVDENLVVLVDTPNEPTTKIHLTQNREYATVLKLTLHITDHHAYEGKLYGTFETVRPVVNGTL